MPRRTSGYTTAAETARRLGVSVRALRVYERHGLVRPARTAVGWRLYGPEQLSQLQQVLAFKRFGLKLAQIAGLVRGGKIDIDRLLALHEEELQQRKLKMDRALALVRDTRMRIANGTPLPIEELTALIKEARMSNTEVRPQFWDLWSKHIGAERLKAVHPDWFTGAGKRFGAQWLALIAEAERLKDSDPGAPAALDLARRALSFIGEFTRFDPELTACIKNAFREGYADPEMAPHMPYSEGMRRFMDAAIARLHAAERPDSSDCALTPPNLAIHKSGEQSGPTRGAAQEAIT